MSIVNDVLNSENNGYSEILEPGNEDLDSRLVI